MIKSMEAINEFIPPLNKLAKAMKTHNETFEKFKNFGKHVKRVLGQLADATNHWYKKTGEGDLVPMEFLAASMNLIVQPIRYLSNAIERYGESMRDNTDFGKNIFKILSPWPFDRFVFYNFKSKRNIHRNLNTCA